MGFLVLIVIPILLWIQRRAWRRSDSILASSIPLREMVRIHRKARSWGRRAMLLSLILFITARAGPRWGRSDESGIIRGRDLVVLIDLSKSMLAEDMQGSLPRWQAVQAGLRHLLDTVEQRGGHRLAFVVFAAKPWVICPLTSDYDYLRLKIDELNPNLPPPEIYPNDEEPWVSGTRIGEAIAFGVTIHDPQFPGYQDILLPTDGDDPANLNDREVGILAARNASIPVHVIGIGTFQGALLPGGDLISQLQEVELKQLALETNGEYASWYEATPQLGEFFRSRIESRPSRILSEDSLPQPENRYRLFLFPALVLLLLGWWLEQR